MAEQRRRATNGVKATDVEAQPPRVNTPAEDGDLHDLVGALARIVVRLAKERGAGEAGMQRDEV